MTPPPGGDTGGGGGGGSDGGTGGGEPLADGMIDNFVNSPDFVVAVSGSLGCPMVGDCEPERQNYAVGASAQAGAESYFGTPFDGVILGGYRTAYLSDVKSAGDTGQGNAYTEMTGEPSSPGMLLVSNGLQLQAALTLVWDGQARTFPPNPSGDALPVDPAGLVTAGTPQGLDFTAAGTKLYLGLSDFWGQYYGPDVAFTFDVWSHAGARQATSTITTGGDNQPSLEFPFASFIAVGDPVDFAQVSALRLTISGPQGTELALNSIEVQ